MRSLASAISGVALGLLIGAGAATTASAHTGLDSSDPADGSAVAGPVELVTLEFTGTPTAVDDGILVADADGNEYAPVEVVQDGLQITARFAPPLGAGSYALSWVVRSDDTHTVDGSFTFAVTVPATTPPPTTVPATTAPVTTEVPGSTEVPATTSAPDPPPTTEATPSESESESEPEPEPASESEDLGESVAPPAPPVPPASSSVDDGEAVARIGRLVTFPAAVVAIGLLVFAVAAFVGTRTELDAVLRTGRWLGAVVALGAVIEVVGLRDIVGDDVFDVSSGRAAAARVVGGLLLAVGISAVAGGHARSLSAAVVEVDTGTEEAREVAGWRPRGRDLVGVAGAALVAGSFAFDGHQVTEGSRALQVLASVVHVVAAAAWAGGLVALAMLLWRRRSESAPSAVPMILAFSVVATVALVAAGVAGGLMAWSIDSDVAGYGSTEWGRLLIAKLAIVAVAAAIGGYNHFRVRPALRDAPDDPGLLATTRTTVTIEAALLVGAALVTAVLVGASIL